jgi:hypothetical protein
MNKLDQLYDALWLIRDSVESVYQLIKKEQFSAAELECRFISNYANDIETLLKKLRFKGQIIPFQHSNKKNES